MMAKRKMTERDMWSQGYACACAVLIRGHGEGTEATDTYSANFMTVAQLRAAGVDDDDIEILRPTIKEITACRKAVKEIEEK